MKLEKVILVDSADNAIGEMGKMEAHKRALLHRAVSVFIFNSKKELLLQKRALSKYHSSGLWTNTVCTHPYPDETVKDAAIRRLKEEMGLVTDVHKIFDFIYKEKIDNELTEYEFDHVFIGFTDDLFDIKPYKKYANLYCACLEGKPGGYLLAWAYTGRWLWREYLLRQHEHAGGCHPAFFHCKI